MPGSYSGESRVSLPAENVAAISAFVSSAICIGCALRDRLALRDPIPVIIAMLGGIGLLYARTMIQGISFEGFLRTISLANVLVLLSTLGRPYLLFDVSVGGARKRRMSKAERAEIKKRDQAVGRSQLTFLALVLLVVIPPSFFGWDFLN
jgi:hypothetical protein